MIGALADQIGCVSKSLAAQVADVDLPADRRAVVDGVEAGLDHVGPERHRDERGQQDRDHRQGNGRLDAVGDRPSTAPLPDTAALRFAIESDDLFVAERTVSGRADGVFDFGVAGDLLQPLVARPLFGGRDEKLQLA